MFDLNTMKGRLRAKADTSNKAWYRIKAAADEAEIWIFDEISWFGITAADFVAELRQVSAPKVTVHINSPGGDVFDGVAIMTALRTHPAHVTTRVEGLAASAASVIAQGGDRRVMVEHGQLMIHQAHGVVFGEADDMREFADLLDRQNEVLAGIYAERSGRDVDEFRPLMAAETWFTDQEAVDAGLADEVFTPPRKEAAEAKATGNVLTAAQLNTISSTNGGGKLTFTINPDLSAASVAAGKDLVAELQDLTRPGGEKPEEGINQTAAKDLLAAFTLKEGTPNE